MTHTLRNYLADHPWHHESVERWPVQVALRVRLSLCGTLPPANVSSSVLAIVLRGDGRVLFLHPDNPSGGIAQLLPGGRPEPGESPEQTVIREVGEETGWQIEPLGMIGFRHFFHLEPWAKGTDRPYPDFIQPIFAASAIRYDAGLIRTDDHIPSDFFDFAELERVTDPRQRPLLYAAANAVWTTVPD